MLPDHLLCASIIVSKLCAKMSQNTKYTLNFHGKDSNTCQPLNELNVLHTFNLRPYYVPSDDYVSDLGFKW